MADALHGHRPQACQGRPGHALAARAESLSSAGHRAQRRPRGACWPQGHSGLRRRRGRREEIGRTPGQTLYDFGRARQIQSLRLSSISLEFSFAAVAVPTLWWKPSSLYIERLLCRLLRTRVCPRYVHSSSSRLCPSNHPGVVQPHRVPVFRTKYSKSKPIPSPPGHEKRRSNIPSCRNVDRRTSRGAALTL